MTSTPANPQICYRGPREDAYALQRRAGDPPGGEPPKKYLGQWKGAGND